MKLNILIVLLLVLAGCSTAPTDPTSQPSVETDSPTTATPQPTTQPPPPSTTAVRSTTTSQPTTATQTTAALANNPWQQETIAVAIAQPNSDGRDYRPLVRDALDYWELNSSTYTEFDVEFELVEYPKQADVIIEFHLTVSSCGYQTTEKLLGCAPVYSPERTFPIPTRVSIEAGYVNSTTIEIIKHELGHTLGLRHQSSPPFMEASGYATRLTMPNATERRIPYKEETVTVYIDYSDVRDGIQYSYENAIQHALDYYNDGAGGTEPESLELKVVDNPEDANIVIRIADDRRDRFEDIRVFGYDEDSDPELEYYNNATIVVNGYSSPDTGWIVGYYLGYALGATSADELAPPFRDGEIDDGNWWK
ncbi:hypothetical protein ACFQH3_12080 [Haladaptatus sp. GCM10025707]|uniref:hypothetical protein n=1 Tax=unclassified Haladaptatus TaxID=2622732 RepID=UPI0023E7DBD2|nr:hypothetical protein [Haladaptatus sp. QDMS2]